MRIRAIVAGACTAVAAQLVAIAVARSFGACEINELPDDDELL